MADARTLAPCCRLCRSERSEESRDHAYGCWVRFFTPLRSVQNDMTIRALRAEWHDLESHLGLARRPFVDVLQGAAH